MIFMIVESDWPFHGDLAIGPQAYEVTLRTVMSESD